MKQTGLTLIELIVTLAVISVLLVVGIPQFKSTTANSRLTTTSNTLTGDLSLASNNDWSNGWTTAVTVSGATTNIRFAPALVANTAINTSGVASVTFSPDGRSSAAVTFNLCDDRSGTFGKSVNLLTTGQTFLTTNVQCN